MNQNTKSELEELFWNDARRHKTSIVRNLSNNAIRSELQAKYPKLYHRLYIKTSGEVDISEVRRLLFADRGKMKKYIEEFGSYAYEKDKADWLLKNIFCYDRFSNRGSAIKILRKLNTKVCPYCNRQYVITLQNGKVRAQFDHYYPKSLYPYLALSLYNLIPSCSVCNMAKSSLDTKRDAILYPYDEEFGYDVKFDVRYDKDDFVKMIQGIGDKFEIQIVSESKLLNDKVEMQVKKLHLEELYNEHKDYVKDIIRSNYINTPERIDEIYSKFPQLFRSKEEVKSLLCMTDLCKDGWEQRSLAKLTVDINRQFS